MMQMLKQDRVHLALFALLALALLLPLTASTPLYGPWEVHYGQVAREMIHYNNWLNPMYREEVFWTKPILAPFLALVMYKTLGVSEFSTRLPAILFGLWGLVGVFGIVRRSTKSRWAAWAVAGSLLLTPYYSLMARRFLTDIFFTAPLILGLLWFWESLETGQKRKASYAWMMLALGVLSKGLVPLFIALGTVVSYMLMTGNLSRWRRLTPISGIVIFLIVTVPWHAYMTGLHGTRFLKVWFIDNHFKRAAGELGIKPTGMYEFLILYLGLGTFPTLGFAPFGLLALGNKEENGQANPRRRLALLLLAYLAAAALVVFSSSTKYAHYVFATVPPLAMLAGLGMVEFFQQKDATRQVRLLLLLFAGVVTMILAKDIAHGANWHEFTKLTSDHRVRPNLGNFTNPRPFILTTAAIMACGLGLLALPWKRFIQAGLGVVLAACLFWFGFFFYSFDADILWSFTPKKLSETYKEQRKPGEKMIVWGNWKTRSETWYGDVVDPFLWVRSKHGERQFKRFVEQQKGKRFFVNVALTRVPTVRRIVKQVTGEDLTPIASDRYHDYEGIVLLSNRAEGQAVPFEATLLDKEPTPKISLGMTLQQAELIGVDAPSSVERGDTLEVTLYWRCKDAMRVDWMRFAHLETSPGERLVEDGYPGGGTYNTSSWRKGDIIRDRIRFHIPSSQGKGTYTLYTGLYLRQRRMPVLEPKTPNGSPVQGNRIAAMRITIR